MEYQWDIGIKNRKKFTTEIDYSDLLSHYKSDFAQMPMSPQNKNILWSDLIKMVPELNFLKFKQTDYPSWLPWAFIRNSIHMKMTISQEPLIEIDPTYCQNNNCI